METLNLNVIIHIAAYLKVETLFSLANSNKSHQIIVNQVKETPIFWKGMVESFLEIYLSDIITNRWKDIYMLISKAKNLSSLLIKNDVLLVKILLRSKKMNLRLNNNRRINRAVSEAMYVATRKGHLELVKLLLEHGADSTTADNRAIRMASRGGALDIVKLLLKHGADPTANNNDAIRSAGANGYIEVVKLLLEHGADPTADDSVLIKIFSADGRLNLVKLLLKHGADPTTYDNSAIQFASESGHIEIVKLLLEQPGVDPTANYNYVIKSARREGHSKIVTLLRKHGATLKAPHPPHFYL